MSDETPDAPPAWAIPVIACVRDNHQWLLDALGLVALAAMEGEPLAAHTTPARVLALQEIIAAEQLPYEARNAEDYARRVLLLLASPKAALFTVPELQAIIVAVVSAAMDRCLFMAQQLEAPSAPSPEPGIPSPAGPAPG
jgi:hypothetical protein